ncbi:MAG: VOC family protein [Bradyrhizobium sp.]|nr:VOC family protein [Bradyrhizobium sp.]MDE2332088.1 VOC family protein [Bradyrhizobium sp.]
MAGYHGRFIWYELITTDMAAARAFYTRVVGWSAQDQSRPDLAYTVFCSGTTPVSGLMDLPQEARRMGATARWMGYISVDDVDAAADRLRHLGGRVYVPPTSSNIGRISVVADPQNATLALVDGLITGQQRLPEPNKPGRVGWHELLAADHPKAFAFYRELFDWRKAGAESRSTEAYQVVLAGEATIGGMLNKDQTDPVPFWLFYFNVGDIDAAIARVEVAGGLVSDGPLELPGGDLIARCIDPQGAAFALQGKRSQDGIGRVPASDVGWSTEWGRISSRGRLVVNKMRKDPTSDSGG